MNEKFVISRGVGFNHCAEEDVMRCPKCGYISFDHITSCSKCSNDLTEISASLKGTGFQSLGTFFLGELIPDYGGAAPAAPLMEGLGDFDQEIPDMPLSADLGDPSGLNIDLSDLQELGDLPDLPDDDGGADFSMGSDDLALDGLDVPEVDLSQFDAGDDEPEGHGFSAGAGDDLSLDDHDVPDMDLDEIDFDGEGLDEAGPAASASRDNTMLDVEMEEDLLDMPDLDMDISMADDDQAEAKEESGISLADIDLSLGDDDQPDVESEDEVMDLADLDLGDAVLDMDKDADAMDKSQDAELPDLEFE